MNATQEKTRRVLAWSEGSDPLPGPHRMTVFPTNICNIKCKHCWQRWADYDKSYKSEMSDERLLALVDEAAELGVKEWYFVGGGEPMARGKLIMEMIEKIRALGMNGGIHTNGTLFRPGMLERLVDLQWASIRVSMDGPTAEINDDIRTGGFEKAIENVRKLSELKRAAGSDLPDVALYTTVTNMTYDKIVQFVQLARSCGPDVGIELSGLIVQSEGSASLDLSKEQVHEYPRFVREGLALAEELQVPNNFRAYVEEELVLDTMNMQRMAPRPASGLVKDAVCFEPWTSVSIMPDGKLGPCCAFYSDNALSVKDQTFAEVWYGAYMQQVRHSMTVADPPDYCSRCPSNMFLNKERMRDHFVAAIEWQDKQASWRSMNRVARVRHLIGRTMASVKERGLKGTVDRTMEWFKVQRNSRVG